MTEFGLQYPDAKNYKGHSFDTRISNCVTNIVRHHDQDEREADGAMHRSIILPVWRGRFQNQLEKDFTDEDCLHCPYLGSFKTRFEICKDENGEIYIYIYMFIYIYIRAIQVHSGGMIVSPRLMNYVMIPERWKPFIYHVSRVERETNTPLQKLDRWQEERNVKKEGRQISSLLLILSTAMQTKQNLSQISRNQGKYIIKFIGDLNKMQCTRSTCPQHKTLVLNFGRQVLTPFLQRMRRKGCQRKWKERIVRQTTYLSNRTKSNTQSIMGSYEIQRRAHSSGCARIEAQNAECLGAQLVLPFELQQNPYELFPCHLRCEKFATLALVGILVVAVAPTRTFIDHGGADMTQSNGKALSKEKVQSLKPVRIIRLVRLFFRYVHTYSIILRSGPLVPKCPTP